MKRLISRKYLLLAGLALALLFMVRAAGGSLLHGDGIRALGFFDVTGRSRAHHLFDTRLGLLWISNPQGPRRACTHAVSPHILCFELAVSLHTGHGAIPCDASANGGELRRQQEPGGHQHWL